MPRPRRDAPRAEHTSCVQTPAVGERDSAAAGGAVHPTSGGGGGGVRRPRGGATRRRRTGRGGPRARRRRRGAAGGAPRCGLELALHLRGDGRAALGHTGLGRRGARGGRGGLFRARARRWRARSAEADWRRRGADDGAIVSFRSDESFFSRSGAVFENARGSSSSRSREVNALRKSTRGKGTGVSWVRTSRRRSMEERLYCVTCDSTSAATSWTSETRALCAAALALTRALREATIITARDRCGRGRRRVDVSNCVNEPGTGTRGRGRSLAPARSRAGARRASTA